MPLNRNEEGIYYAIDLGGTSFRVLRVEVGMGSVISQKVEDHTIPEEFMGSSEVLVLSCLIFFYILKICFGLHVRVIFLTAGFIQPRCLGTKEYCRTGRWKR